MFKCIFVKKKLYDYLDGSLSEKAKDMVKNHLQVCVACKEKTEQMKLVLSLAKDKSVVHPTEEFWHTFTTGLDQKLNERLVPPYNLKPALGLRFKPALAASLVSIFLIVMSVSLHLYNRQQLFNRSVSALVEEITSFEEVSQEIVSSNGEDVALEDIYLFYHLDQGL